MLPFLIQGLYAIRRELLLTLRPASEIIAGWIGVASIIGIILLPVGISIGSTYLSVVKSEPYRIPFPTRAALWWIDDHAARNDVIIASPDSPYLVPLFTGLSILRLNDYWLSAQDDVMHTLVSAFMGDRDAQTLTLTHGKYLLLSKNDSAHWDTTKLKKVFEALDAIVYKTR